MRYPTSTPPSSLHVGRVHAQREQRQRALIIKTLDQTFYQPLVSRLLLRDQCENTDLLTMQQRVCECFSAHVRAQPSPGFAAAHADRRFGDPPDTGHSHLVDGDSLSDLRDMVLALKRQITVIATKAAARSRGFTPRGPRRRRTVAPPG
ncbi:hypothetical protein CYMTET_27264 [Cymbomonas tetramitiformis]|uniref:Uncharacterized protein n=1 Tax=Cymbomonas tetramitiformis TaxID=36881 RepID=A0AAE0FQH3_9CHLO|nr:hypothetical protein CYMTET_27264 [Cymbomonas tetramitiformis]